LIAKGGVRPDHYYLHRDYLGSILAITDQLGRVVEKRHFDAWGNLVFVKDGQDNDLGQLTFLDRGYTGHEHLQGVALVHMNGRLYDPTVRRFLAPDNFIQDISNTQNFNRYGYVWNNPLVYTDQNGEWIHIAIGAVIGGLVNWGIHGFKLDASGLKAFGIGAAAGALGAATGGIAFTAFGGAAGGLGGFLAGAASGVVSTYFQNLVLSIGNASYLSDNMLTMSEHFSSMAVGGAFGGLFNGVSALANGRSFMTGASSMPKVEAITMNAAGLASKATDTNLSSSATMKSVPDLAYTNQVKNSVTKVVPLRAVDGGIQGGPLRIPNTTGSTVLEEITVNASKNGTKALVPFYPPNGGAMGGWSKTTLTVGTQIDRYGSSYGKYFSPIRTPLQMRALPPGNTGALTKYQVIKPFDVQSSVIAPYYYEVGTGIQYYSPFLNADELVRGGFLKQMIK